MTDRQLYILDQFSNEQLSPSEQKEFDTYLEQLEFKEAVQTTKDLNIVIQHERSEAFRKKMQSWDANDPVNPTKMNFSKWIWIGLVLLGLGLIYMILLKPTPVPQMEQLYAEYAKPYKNIYLPVSRSETDESMEMHMMAEYENGNYQEVVNKLQELPMAKQSDGVLFYVAVSHFMLGDLSRADQQFIALENVDKYGTPSQWDRFLIAIKMKDEQNIRSASKVLTSQSAHPVLKRKTEELLKRME